MIQRVKRSRAYEDIVSQLSDLIERGELKPGDRLPAERELAQAFGVGRPTLRQALTVLAEAGVVEILPGSGVYLRNSINGAAPGQAGHAMGMVLLTEKQNPHDIIELRIGIEGEAAYLAAQRRTPEQVEKLKVLFQNLENAYLNTGYASEEDFQFHATIAEATGNPVFVKVMTSLADLFMQHLRETTHELYYEPDRVHVMRREHESILSAIIEQRAGDAREAMIKHLERVAERLRRAERVPEIPNE